MSPQGHLEAKGLFPDKQHYPKKILIQCHFGGSSTTRRNGTGQRVEVVDKLLYLEWHFAAGGGESPHLVGHVSPPNDGDEEYALASSLLSLRLHILLLCIRVKRHGAPH